MNIADNDSRGGGLENVRLEFYIIKRNDTENADAGLDDELKLIFVEHTNLLKFFNDCLYVDFE